MSTQGGASCELNSCITGNTKLVTVLSRSAEIGILIRATVPQARAAPHHEILS